jgi:hypothetical protein
MDVDAAPAADEEKPKKKKSKAEVRLPEIIPLVGCRVRLLTSVFHVQAPAEGEASPAKKEKKDKKDKKEKKDKKSKA